MILMNEKVLPIKNHPFWILCSADQHSFFAKTLTQSSLALPCGPLN